MKLQMGSIETDAVCYPDGLVAHRQRKDGSVEFSLDELKTIISRWNAFEEDGVASNLYEVCKNAHEAINSLFTMLITKDEKFLPSKSGQPWNALQQCKKTIEELEKCQVK